MQFQAKLRINNSFIALRGARIMVALFLLGSALGACGVGG
jgi:hypothetical protein